VAAASVVVASAGTTLSRLDSSLPQATNSNAPTTTAETVCLIDRVFHTTSVLRARTPSTIGERRVVHTEATAVGNAGVDRRLNYL
jgi:hypothetical protein